jgi:hypothetical protein
VPHGPPPITRITFLTCRAHYPGGSRRVHLSVPSPSRAAFPVTAAGRHPHLRFRDLLRLHSRYGPLDCSTAQGGLCHEASVQPVTRLNRSSAIRPNRHLSERILPPLVIRAVGAHAVAVVVAVEEPAFLLSVQRIIGGIEIERDLRRGLGVGIKEQINEQRLDGRAIGGNAGIAGGLLAAEFEPVQRDGNPMRLRIGTRSCPPAARRRCGRPSACSPASPTPGHGGVGHGR